MLATSLTRFAEIEKYARRTINSVAAIERGANQPKQPRIFLISFGYRLFKLSVIATGRNFEHVAHGLNAVSLLVRLYELVGEANMTAIPFSAHEAPPGRCG